MRGIRVEAADRGELRSRLLRGILGSFLGVGEEHPGPVKRCDPAHLVGSGSPRHNPMFEHLFEHVNVVVHSPRDH